jgi:deazaflavin-dependent oxidoreductase (nitroreductase family)
VRVGRREKRTTDAALTAVERFWRNRGFARARHRLLRLGRSVPLVTRAHARVIRLSGGRMRRSFVFAGGLPVLVLTTIGRRTGQRRSTPLGYLRYGDGYAVLAANAGSDRVPAWWLNLQAEPQGEILVGRARSTVLARRANAAEDRALWQEFARLNPGYDEYRTLTDRPIPVVILERSEAGRPAPSRPPARPVGTPTGPACPSLPDPSSYRAASIRSAHQVASAERICGRIISSIALARPVPSASLSCEQSVLSPAPQSNVPSMNVP